jgi:hypothetical protein
VREIVEVINSGIQPIQNLAVTKHLQCDQEGREKWNGHWINVGFKGTM